MSGQRFPKPPRPREPRPAPVSKPKKQLVQSRLFSDVHANKAAVLDTYAQVIDAILGLKKKHAAALPDNIKQLSDALTSRRGEGLRPNYMADPRILSAYVSYFLPWNLFRLVSSIPGLRLELPEKAVIVDLGSGPLTFVQALYIARPDLRQRELVFHCYDTAGAALKMGKDLFLELVKRTEGPQAQSPWRIEIEQAPLQAGLTRRADLVVAINVVNEFVGFSRQGGNESEMYAIAEKFLFGPAHPKRILFVEPGTRMASANLVRLREAFIELGALLNGPCTHSGTCPYGNRMSKGWCHFIMPAKLAPGWLQDLSKQAGLHKERAGLAFLDVQGRDATAPEDEKKSHLGRVLSDAFPLRLGPSGGDVGRYVCAEGGLVVVAGEIVQTLKQGDVIQLDGLDAQGKDEKSGLPLLGYAVSREREIKSTPRDADFTKRKPPRRR